MTNAAPLASPHLDPSLPKCDEPAHTERIVLYKCLELCKNACHIKRNSYSITGAACVMLHSSLAICNLHREKNARSQSASRAGKASGCAIWTSCCRF